MNDVFGMLGANRPWGWRAIALVMAGGLFMLNLDSAIIATSLPQMAKSFGRHPVELSLAISAYILAGAAAVPLSGWLADRIGARRLLLIALLVFTLASVACGLAQSFWPFVIARVVQGAGGSIMMPVGTAVVLRHTDRSRTIQAIGLVTWPAPDRAGARPGDRRLHHHLPELALELPAHVPLGAILLVLMRIILPEHRAAERRRLDITGLGLCSSAMIFLLAGLDMSSGDSAHPAIAIALVVLACILGILAVRHLKRHPAPILSLLPMRARSFALSIAGPGMPFRAVFSATPFLLPLLFQIGYGLSAVASGLLVLVYFIGNLGMKSLTTLLIQRISFRSLLIGNGIIVAVTVGACGWLDPAMPRPILLALLLAAGAARSLQFTALTTLGFAEIDPKLKNDASTLSSLIIQGTMAAGVAIAAFLLNLAQSRHAGHGAGPGDFRLVFEVLAVISLLAAVSYIRLPRGTGDEIRVR